MSAKKGARFAGVVSKFNSSLGELTKHLKASQLHFIRCFKPNPTLTPKQFDAAKVAKHSVAKGITVREAVVDLGFVERGEVTEQQLDELLDVLSMTSPGL